MKSFLTFIVFALVITSALPAFSEVRGGAVSYVITSDNIVMAEHTARFYDYSVLGFWGEEEWIQLVKQLNPSYKAFSYNSLTDNYVDRPGEHDIVLQKAAELGIDPEEAYLHYSEPTTLVIEGEVKSFPSYDQDPVASRVVVYYKNLSRRATNFSTDNALTLQTAVIKQETYRGIPESSIDSPDGYFFDNSPNVLWNTGTIQVGGNVREAGGLVVGTKEFNNWHWSENTRKFLLHLQKNTTGEICINVSNSWTDDYATKFDGYTPADHIFMEWQYNTYRNNGVDEMLNIRDRELKMYNAGVVSWQLGLPITQKGSCEEISLEDSKMGSFAIFLTSRSPKTLFSLQKTNRIDDPQRWFDLNWMAAIEVADTLLGNPVGEMYLLQEGTDPDGHLYKVWARNHQNGISYVRMIGRWDQCPTPTSVVSVDLGGNFYPVTPDGQVRQQTSTVSLINSGAGFALIDPGAVVSPPEPIPDPEPVPDPDIQKTTVMLQFKWIGEGTPNMNVSLDQIPVSAYLVQPDRKPMENSFYGNSSTILERTIINTLTDSTGVASFELVPNSLIYPQSVWKISARNPQAGVFYIAVPADADTVWITPDLLN